VILQVFSGSSGRIDGKEGAKVVALVDADVGGGGQSGNEKNDPKENLGDLVQVGGISRVKGDIAKPDSPIKLDRKLKNREAESDLAFAAMPKQAGLKTTEDARIKKAHDQMTQGGEGISLFQEASPFDYAKYLETKEEYLSQYVPARVFQTAQPAKGIRPLAPRSEFRQELISGESVNLIVRGKPGYPVTFVALDLGAFENKLNCITVESDSEGIAKAVFLATPGTIHKARVMAGSPGSSESVTFELLIKQSR
jgi:hypothetical protein